jgi:hypothetical protein
MKVIKDKIIILGGNSNFLHLINKGKEEEDDNDLEESRIESTNNNKMNYRIELHIAK